MKANTLQMLGLTLAGDDSITDAERKAILVFCRNPVLPAPREPPVAHVPDRWLSPKQAAGLLSVNIRTVQRLVKSGSLPSRKLLGHRRIPWSSVRSLRDGDSESPKFRLPDSTGGEDCVGKGAMAVE